MNGDGNCDNKVNLQSTVEVPVNTDECTVCCQPFIGKERARPGNCPKNTCILCLECLKRICKESLIRGHPCCCPFDRKPFDEVLILGKKKGILERIPVEELQKKDDPTYCKDCGGCDKQETIVQCLWCDYGFHMECVGLEYFPLDDWSCPMCSSESGTSSPSTEYEFSTASLTRRGLPAFTVFESPYALSFPVEQEEPVQETPWQDDQATARSESSSNNPDVIGPIMDSMDDLNSSRINVPTLPTNSSISNAPISEPTVSSLNDAYNPRDAHNAEEAVVQEKHKKKSARRQQISDEVTLALEPYYKRKIITKDDCKKIMKKSVKKIEESRKGVDRDAVGELVQSYMRNLDSLPLYSPFAQKSARRQRHEQIIDEVKLALKPFYKRGKITKDDHNQIMKKSIEKIKKSGEMVDRYAVGRLVEQEAQRSLTRFP